VIHLDSSVVLARLLGEDRRPRAESWEGTFAASRLMQYEVGVRLDARGLGESHRALDAFHLAAIEYLRRRRSESIELATYDVRMRAAAEALGVPLAAV
jgi:hypothetical protein